MRYIVLNKIQKGNLMKNIRNHQNLDGEKNKFQKDKFACFEIILKYNKNIFEILIGEI